jgi:hypothetical protein
MGSSRAPRSLSIYADDRHEAEWFRSLDARLSRATVRLFSKESRPIVDALCAYDNPDIVLLVDGVPVLVVEKTSQVPTGSNIGQRFARMVRAAELGVPSVLFFPFVAMKHGRHASPCWANPWYFEAMSAVSAVHDAPFLGISWPTDDHYELLMDGSEDAEMTRFIEQFIDWDYCIDDHPMVDDLWAAMDDAKATAIENNAYWPSPPPSVEVVDTYDWLNTLGLSAAEVPDYVLERDETVVYTCGTSNVRSDPYTGMQFVYDYALARNGRFPSSKTRNFVVHLSKFEESEWLDAVPRDTETKKALWYATADAIQFASSTLFLHDA